MAAAPTVKVGSAQQALSTLTAAGPLFEATVKVTVGGKPVAPRMPPVSEVSGSSNHSVASSSNTTDTDPAVDISPKPVVRVNDPYATVTSESTTVSSHSDRVVRTTSTTDTSSTSHPGSDARSVSPPPQTSREDHATPPPFTGGKMKRSSWMIANGGLPCYLNEWTPVSVVGPRRQWILMYWYDVRYPLFLSPNQPFLDAGFVTLALSIATRTPTAEAAASFSLPVNLPLYTEAGQEQELPLMAPYVCIDIERFVIVSAAADHPQTTQWRSVALRSLMK